MGATADQVPGVAAVREEQATGRTSSIVVAADPYGVDAVIVSNPSVPEAVTVAA
jgi:hypothetical protein